MNEGDNGETSKNKEEKTLKKELKDANLLRDSLLDNGCIELLRPSA